MKEKIMAKASELFLKLGFKSITMDDIAGEMCISKKTIYKYFCNKEVLIEESTEVMHKEVHQSINAIEQQNYNAIQENFEIRKMFKEMFNAGDTSPMYQLNITQKSTTNSLIEKSMSAIPYLNKISKKELERDCTVRIYL